MTSCDSNFADGPCPEEATRYFEIITSPGFAIDVNLCGDCGDAFVAEDGPIQVREVA